MNPLEDCHCDLEYSIELHGDGYALYYGRCPHRHGHNLVHLTEEAWNFDAEHLTLLLNLGNKEYKKNPTGGHVAE